MRGKEIGITFSLHADFSVVFQQNGADGLYDKNVCVKYNITGKKTKKNTHIVFVALLKRKKRGRRKKTNKQTNLCWVGHVNRAIVADHFGKVRKRTAVIKVEVTLGEKKGVSMRRGEWKGKGS